MRTYTKCCSLWLQLSRATRTRSAARRHSTPINHHHGVSHVRRWQLLVALSVPAAAFCVMHSQILYQSINHQWYFTCQIEELHTIINISKWQATRKAAELIKLVTFVTICMHNVLINHGWSGVLSCQTRGKPRRDRYRSTRHALPTQGIWERRSLSCTWVGCTRVWSGQNVWSHVVTSAPTLAVFRNSDSKPTCSLDRSFVHALTDAWWFSSFYLG